MANLTVGTGEQYGTLSAAIAASHDGDVLLVQANTYVNDFSVINTKITIEGVGGQVNLVATVPPPNGKAILVTNADVTLDNLSFSGVQVSDGNGAGVRYQAGNLTINDCYFHNDQDGLLAASNAAGTISINQSEFAYNGTGDGLTHNLYVGDIAKLTIEQSYFHDADAGHEIKSRAATTVIDNSRIFDGPDGTASYSVDLPNGGNATITRDFIEQGPHSTNPAIIHFGGEGTPYAGSSLTIADNTFVNDLGSANARALLNQTTIRANFIDNSVWGLTAKQLATGPLLASDTRWLATRPTLDTSEPWSSALPSQVAGAAKTPPDLLPLAPAIVAISPSGPASLPSAAPGSAFGSTAPPSIAPTSLVPLSDYP